MAAANPAQGEDASRPVGLTFGDFLAKMKEPAAADLVRSIKSFIRQFEERPPGQPSNPEADSAAVQAFLAQSEGVFRQHPVWRGCQPEVLDQAVEGLEKYLMSKVWRQTFGSCSEDRERDERYQRLMQALGFVDLPTLMGADVQPDEALLGMAQAEFLKMDRYKAPRDKLLCLVNVKTMVENIVGLAAKNGANIGGADAFFPVFLFILIRSRLPRLASNVEYVKRFRMRARLSGQFDYMLCNLESGAMYLDTVNYEHLSVSQEAFLRHLAAAGIPEAHMELHRMQQDADLAALQAAEVAEAAELAEAAEVAEAAELAAMAAAAEGSEGAEAGGDATAASVAAGQERQVGAGDADDDADVLAGLQLAEGEGGAPRAPSAAESEASGLGSVQASMPATPTDASAILFGKGGSGSGRLSLTPLPAEDSPVLLGTSAMAGAGGGVAGAAEQQQPGGLVPRGLSFDPASELASATEQQEQHQLQRQQQAEEQAASAAAVAAALSAAGQEEGYEEAVLIEEMVGEGTRYVLAAEAAGQLQQRYPFMYAQAEDLSLSEVEAVLVGYKELLLRYEALSRTLQQQLGLGGASSGSPDMAEAEAAAAHGHRGKAVQEQFGFGSIIPPGVLEAAGADGGVWAPGPQLMLAAPSGQARLAASASAEASPNGRWSPGGLLQRIASRGRVGRSLTPPRDWDGSRAAAAGNAGQGGGEQQLGAPGELALKAASPGKQGPHPFFTTLFGGSSSSSSPTGAAPVKPRGQQEPLAAAPPPMLPQQQQPLAAAAAAPGSSSEPLASAEAFGSAGDLDGASQQPQQQQRAGDSNHAGPELSFAGYDMAQQAQHSPTSPATAPAAPAAGVPPTAVAAAAQGPAGSGSLMDFDLAGEQLTEEVQAAGSASGALPAAQQEAEPMGVHLDSTTMILDAMPGGAEFGSTPAAAASGAVDSISGAEAAADLIQLSSQGNSWGQEVEAPPTAAAAAAADGEPDGSDPAAEAGRVATAAFAAVVADTDAHTAAAMADGEGGAELFAAAVNKHDAAGTETTVGAAAGKQGASGAPEPLSLL